MDFEVVDQGSTVVFVPMSDEGRDFLWHEVRSEPSQWRGDSLCVDRRTADSIVAAIEASGLLWIASSHGPAAA